MFGTMLLCLITLKDIGQFKIFATTEVPEEHSEPTYNVHGYKKPETYNLLLPSIHSSRTDNVLVTESNAQQAVDALLADCQDSQNWPSTAFINKDRPVNCPTEAEVRAHADRTAGDRHRPSEVPTPVHPQSAKYKPPGWAYDVLDPQVIIAARNLFFERRRQQITYLNWNNPKSVPRLPSDYELFAIWASLPKSEKMTYVSEVNNGLAANVLPINCVETQRAVSALYNSSPNAVSWPSHQFIRAQPPSPVIPHTHTYPLMVNSILPYRFEAL